MVKNAFKIHFVLQTNSTMKNRKNVCVLLITNGTIKNKNVKKSPKIATKAAFVKKTLPNVLNVFKKIHIFKPKSIACVMMASQRIKRKSLV